METPPAVLLLLRIAFANWGYLSFQMKLIWSFHVLLRIVQEFWWGLYWTCRWFFCRMAIFTILILSIHEHVKSFPLLIPSSIYFFSDWKMLSFKSLICWVRVVLRYFILSKATVKGVASLRAFSICLLFLCYWFWYVNFYPDTLLKVFISRRLLDEIFRVACVHYCIICK